MSRFFIDRPIFAWVLAILLMMLGAVCITRLPITPYPSIAPPSVAVVASYPGADAKTVQDSVTQVIEQALTGLDGLLYMSGSSSSNGDVNITLTFTNTTNPDIAQVQVQNRLQSITALLPPLVQQQGVSVSKSNENFLMALGFMSEDGTIDELDMSDYVMSTIKPQIARVPGVGGVREFGAQYAMRIWLDPNKLRAFSLTPTDIVNAVRANNSQFSVGQLGGVPQVADQQINATITARGRLQNADEFNNIVIRSDTSGGVLRLRDVARVEIGASDYNFTTLANGKPATGIGIQLASGANALKTAQKINEKLEELKGDMPHGLKVFIPFDSTPFVRSAIKEVVKTLIEAIVLVFVVMFLFLQNWRATLIPTIAVPVVLLGTFPVLLMFGYSINMLTMFAVVLAIGLLVDDAIVVVENVERLMVEEHLSPLEATKKSMRQITGALIGIGTVLTAVFLPMAFLDGSTGVIYRQFSVTIVTAMALSVLVALTLTPALCATLLRAPAAHSLEGDSLFSRFNRWFHSTTLSYQSTVKNMLGRLGRNMLIYLGLAALMSVLFFRLPTAFLPPEDQGHLYLAVQAPNGATQQRTNKVMEEVQRYFVENESKAVQTVFTVQGWSFIGTGQNLGLGFVLFRDWDDRPGADSTPDAVAARTWGGLSHIKDAQVFALAPPAISELGNAAGFDFYLKDEGKRGHQALIDARTQLLELVTKDPRLVNVRFNGQDDSSQFKLDIDADKAASLGVNMNEINDTLSMAWGGRYIDDFVDRGTVKRVFLQSDAPYRMNPEDVNRWYVRNNTGNMVPVSAFTTGQWSVGAAQLDRYNGFAAAQFNGEAAPGISSGTAMQVIESLAKQLPSGFRIEWTGQSYQERQAGSQTPILYLLSLVVIFLALAALYESWAMPIPILMAVPLGIIGAVFATSLRGLERDVYFQVGMLTTIGLSSKNAILIVEFAKLNMDHGMHLIEATLHAVKDRLRPILMTSFAFGFGVLPLALAHGAGAGAQRAIGTGIFGGMIAGTLLGIFFVPVVFVYLEKLLDRKRHTD